eukprot:TRINITY_DN21020_c0_g1_i1.p5 TRINITY_DN21020_c0_g1~~TRINITY_DN21020_c0_g1_i1.p5  ORF type:complete len:120 (-),score=19.21 TRINITY_DN21020_c0_g1_i1:527-886(-)
MTLAVISLQLLLIWSASLQRGTKNMSEDGGGKSDEVLKLPSPSQEAAKIQVGEKIEMRDMGPTVINEDGTISRITNWDSMSERERQVAWKVVTKRNRERLQALQEKEQLDTHQPLKEEL